MRKNDKDPLDQFLDSTLNQEGYTPFYCKTHGKQLVKLPSITIEVNGEKQQPIPLCQWCDNIMTDEDHTERRKRRLRSINKQRKNLEGDE